MSMNPATETHRSEAAGRDRSHGTAPGTEAAARLLTDEAGTIVGCSTLAGQRLGRGRLVGRPFAALVAAADRERAERLMAAAREFRTSGVLRLGEEADANATVRVTAAPISAGGRTCLSLEIADAEEHDGLDAPRPPPPARVQARPLRAIEGVRGDGGAAIAGVERLRGIADHLPAMVAYWTPDLRCAFVNARIREWFGRGPEEVIGMQLADLLGSELFGLIEPGVRAALAGRPQSFERSLRKADGSLGHAGFQCIPDFAGDRVQGLVCVVSDATEIQQAQLALDRANRALVDSLAAQTVSANELAESRQKYRSLLHDMPSGFVYCRLRFEGETAVDYLYIEINRACEALLDLHDVAGRWASEVGDESAGRRSDVLSLFGRVARTGTPERAEVHFRPLGRWLGLSVSRPHEGHLFVLYDDISERKQAFEHLRSAFEASPGAVAISRLRDGQLILVNDALLAIHDCRRDELIGHSSDELGLWRDAGQRERVLEQVRQQGHARNFLVDIVSRRGRIKQVLASLEAIEFDGEPHVLGFQVEVGALEQARTAQLESERCYRSLFANLPSAFLYARVVLDEGKAVDYVHFEVNEAFNRLVGARDVEGRRASEISPGLQHAAPDLLQKGARVALTGQSERFEFHLPETDTWYAATLYCPRAEHFVAILVDVTQRRRADAAVRLAHARFVRLTDSNIVGVAIGNEAGELFFSNDYYLRLIGSTRAELEAGRARWDTATPPEFRPRDAAAFAELRTRGESANYEKEYRLPDGRRTAVEIGLARLPGNDDQVMAIVLDINSRREVQRELQRANLALAARTREAEAASAAKDRFLSTINHELRTPLHLLLGYTRMLLRSSQGEAQCMRPAKSS